MILVSSMSGCFADPNVGLISSTGMFWQQFSKGQFAVGLSCPFRWHLIFSCIKMFCLLHGVLQMPYDIHPQCLLWQGNAWLPYVFIYQTVKYMQCILSSMCVLHVYKYKSVHFIFLCKSEIKSHSVLYNSINIIADILRAHFLTHFSLTNSWYLPSCFNIYLYDIIIIPPASFNHTLLFLYITYQLEW